MGSETELLVSIDDARQRLGGIARSTVYCLIAAGEITKVKIGSKGFVTAESLTAYVGRLKDAGGAA